MKQTETLTAREASKLAGVRLGYFYTVLQEGLIKAERVDGEWRIHRDAFNEWNEGRQGKRQGK